MWFKVVINVPDSTCQSFLINNWFNTDFFSGRTRSTGPVVQSFQNLPSVYLSILLHEPQQSSLTQNIHFLAQPVKKVTCVIRPLRNCSFFITSRFFANLAKHSIFLSDNIGSFTLYFWNYFFFRLYYGTVCPSPWPTWSSFNWSLTNGKYRGGGLRQLDALISCPATATTHTSLPMSS